MDLNQVNAPFQAASLRIDNGPVPVRRWSVPHRRIGARRSARRSSSSRAATSRMASRFDVDSDVVKPDSRPVLEQIADALKSQASVKVRIEGHTDSTGDRRGTWTCQSGRAEAVKKAAGHPVRHRGRPPDVGGLRRHEADCHQRHPAGTRREPPRGIREAVANARRTHERPHVQLADRLGRAA